MTLGIVLIFVK